jgi:hypothetical protein
MLPEITQRPTLKRGDKVYITATEFYDTSMDWLFTTAAYGIVYSYPMWRDDDTANVAGEGWRGPSGWTYYLDLFDYLGNQIPDGPYWFHELELIKCCTTKTPSESEIE